MISVDLQTPVDLLIARATPLRGAHRGEKPVSLPPLAAADLGLVEELTALSDRALAIGKAAKFAGIGVLALAGGVLVFRLTELLFGE